MDVQGQQARQRAVWRRRISGSRRCLGLAGRILAVALLAAGCRSADWHRATADRRALDWIDRLGRDALERDAPAYRLESPAEQQLRQRLLLGQGLPTRTPAPAPKGLPRLEDGPLQIGLEEALQIGAACSREYQTRKEAVFRSALGLDVETEEFRTSWAGALAGQYRDDRAADPSRSDVGASFDPGISRLLAVGASVSARLAMDLTRLLTLDRETAYGLLADATVTIPLLQGAGRRIVLEPLTQAERDVVYALYDFERYKRSFAVRIASDYLGVLERAQQIANAEDNYRRLVLSTARAERMAESGRLPATQVDQTRQDLLRARERLIGARQSLQAALDAFKQTLGLPVDAAIRLDPVELERLAGEVEAVADDEAVSSGEEQGVLQEVEPSWRGLDARAVVQIALTNRLDLRHLEGNLEDARRKVHVARDALRGAVTLEGGASYGERRETGSAERGDARIRPAEGRYRAVLKWDPPWRRARERNRYRESLLDLDRAQRDSEEMEDQIKQQVRGHLRGLHEAYENRRIQARAVQLAERRVASTELFLQAGRAEIRDVLEAQEALVSARNALLSASVRYRTTEWNLLRDLDVLKVTDEGLWNGTDEAE